jgi:glycosyltransferase involved in cell wall biosynthesis
MSSPIFNFSVSVVIPAYNAEGQIGRAIESVLKQTQPAEEIIVVDDGSTDRTAEVVKEHGDAVTYLYQKNAGAAAARNRGIETARSEWIAFLDSDDTYAPRKLERQADLMRANPDLVWCYGNYHVEDHEVGRSRLAHNPDEASERLRGRSFFEDYLAAFSANFPAHTNTMLIRRSVLREVGGFRPDLPWGQDTDLALRMAYRYPRVGYTPHCLAFHHFRCPGGIAHTHRYNVSERRRFLETHLELSARFGRRPAFEACARLLLVRWVRQLFEGADPHEVVEMVRAFRTLIPVRMRWEAEVRSRLPWTARLLPFYFALKRRLRGG